MNEDRERMTYIVALVHVPDVDMIKTIDPEAAKAKFNEYAHEILAEGSDVFAIQAHFEPTESVSSPESVVTAFGGAIHRLLERVHELVTTGRAPQRGYTRRPIDRRKLN